MIGRRAFLLTPLALARAEPSANLVLITASGWRGQAVPWAEDPDLIAPNLKKLGEESVVFSRAYSACPDGLGVLDWLTPMSQSGLETAKFPHAAQLDDETFLHGKKYKLSEALKQFEEPPFAIQVELRAQAEGFQLQPNLEELHLRRNVPPREKGVPEEEGRVDRSSLARFYGSCRDIDARIGEVLEALDQRNLTRDTVVCFTSNCGEQFGSHGLIGSNVPFEESVRIPLAIRYPRELRPFARDLASQVDIMPTLFTLCGLEMPEGIQGVDLLGKTPPEVIYSEGKLGRPGEWRMLVRGYDKIVAAPKGQITHLFNLADDPFELTNLANDSAQRLKLASLKAELLAQMKKLGDGFDPSGLRIRSR